MDLFKTGHIHSPNSTQRRFTNKVTSSSLPPSSSSHLLSFSLTMCTDNKRGEETHSLIIHKLLTRSQMSTLQASLLSKPFLSFPFSSSYPSLCRNTFLSFHSLISSHPHLTRLRRNTFFSFHSLTSSHPHLTHLRSRIPYTFNLDNSVTSSSEPQPKPQPQSQLTNSKPNSVEPDAVDASEVPNSNSTEEKIVVLDWNESSLELSSESIVFGSESEGKSANLKKKKKDEDGGGIGSRLPFLVFLLRIWVKVREAVRREFLKVCNWRLFWSGRTYMSCFEKVHATCTPVTASLKASTNVSFLSHSPLSLVTLSSLSLSLSHAIILVSGLYHCLRSRTQAHRLVTVSNSVARPSCARRCRGRTSRSGIVVVFVFLPQVSLSASFAQPAAGLRFGGIDLFLAVSSLSTVVVAIEAATCDLIANLLSSGVMCLSPPLLCSLLIQFRSLPLYSLATSQLSPTACHSGSNDSRAWSKNLLRS
ncbi:hypothetical protein Ahy_A03g015223 isoform B [Arachis hypogaea]|uniref:Uncharacterized protein n=1 Tax=Arachis hypogaea TaxID=3818 RepID=A0A445DZV1_ARAHY|nr:hypothetical protein Ahy_A03g015223 isoform B [Arachis hypogaea]